jgi:uncharacterized integral membrane protein
MWSKSGITTAAGIFAYVVTILVLFIPFEGEPSMSLINWQTPLGIIVIVVFVVSVVLYFIALFKREIGYPDKEKIVIQRRENLPLLRQTIDALKIRQREIALDIGKMPLEGFYDDYLKNNNDYKRYKKVLIFHKSDEQTKHKVAILLAISRYFLKKPVCLASIMRDDKTINEILEEKNIYYSRNNDKKLSDIIDVLINLITKRDSILAWTELSTNNQLAYKTAEHLAKFDESLENLKELLIIFTKT